VLIIGCARMQPRPPFWSHVELVETSLPCVFSEPLISSIEDRQVIEDILRHLSLWEEKDGPSGLAPPEPPFRLELTCAPVDDDQFDPDESFAE